MKKSTIAEYVLVLSILVTGTICKLAGYNFKYTIKNKDRFLMFGDTENKGLFVFDE